MYEIIIIFKKGSKNKPFEESVITYNEKGIKLMKKILNKP